MSLILDASLTLSWYFADERTAAADELLTRVSEDGAIVPGLWRLEVANAFQIAIRRNRCDAGFRDSALGYLSRLPIETDPETYAVAWTTTLQISERCNLSLYDAAYLELARRRDLPLATLDQPLRTAAESLSVVVLGITA